VTAPISSTETTALVVLVLLVLVLGRRTVRQLSGTRYSASRLYGFAGLYVLLFGVLAFATLYAAVATWGWAAYGLIPVYVAVPVVAAVLAAPHVRKVVRFERRDGGELYYRLSWQVPVLYLALFLTRIVAEVAVFGLAGVGASYPPPAPPSASGLVILVVVDLLFGVSLGLLIGRGVGVYQARQELPPATESPASSPPLPSG
jgi:hypothetical protein